MTAARLVALLIPLLATIPLPGCSLGCDAGYHTRTVDCFPPTSSVQISTQPALELSGPLGVKWARSCLGTDEACSIDAQLNLGTDTTRPGTIALELRLTLPAGLSGTFPLPSSMVGVSGSLLAINATGPSSPTGLRPETGTIVIESSTIAGFVVSFDMVLSAGGNQLISLTQGRVELAGCHSSYICSD